ncbi:hypothetical protein BK133_00915 [Paenibacillus sp. FSL H8-0548]|uniref:BC1872 family protein n=1 Tax=Paenibacillus sp. FSL H8-0548 TaxID=1920422 RepID=UPI00096FAC9C|nr:hypothetical protein [Paenibacillus sp. FSL H8-0548]OMF38795.1 hypothetical protein BK133_00915 [Paenibacillus sp. FSL H8-0548]
MTLTREQVLDMGAGHKLDSEIAVGVFRWDRERVENAMDAWLNGVCGAETIPYYSTDIDAAWKVLEKLQGEWSWEMKMNNAAKEVELRIGKGWATSTNVPLAICRAALLTTIGEGT